MKIEDKITVLLSTIFTSISLVDFKTILDIILIVISILNLIFIIICKIYRYMKNDGKIDKEEAKDLLQDITAVKSKIKEGEEIGRGKGQGQDGSERK